MKKTLLLCLILLVALFALSVTALADADPNDYLTFTDDGSADECVVREFSRTISLYLVDEITMRNDKVVQIFL